MNPTLGRGACYSEPAASAFASYGGGSVKGAGVIAVVGGRGGERVGLACRGGAGCGVARRLGSLIFEPRVGGASGPWVCRSGRCLQSSVAVRGERAGGPQAKARTFVCARCPDRGAASTRQTVVMSVPGLGGGGDLPARADQLAGDGDRDHPGWLAAAFAQKLPARVQPALNAPRLVDERGSWPRWRIASLPPTAGARRE